MIFDLSLIAAISWSGKESISNKVALALRDWIPNVIQTVKPWVSTIDIDAGAQWVSEMFVALKETKVGIICVTRKNQGEPWINFEAGALPKAMESSRVCPLLKDLKSSDVNRAADDLTDGAFGQSRSL